MGIVIYCIYIYAQYIQYVCTYIYIYIYVDIDLSFDHHESDGA
jgi:hypothetical protein